MAKISVRKPFTVLVAVIMVLVLGFVSLTRMPTDLLPNMTLPYIMVITTYPGASPEKVENDVSKPLESALGTVNGVKNVYSTSAENYSMVQLEFEDDTDMDSAMVKLSSALDQVEGSLPESCGTPSVMELSMDMMATMYLSVSYEGKDVYELSDFVDQEVTPVLERQNGVASVSETGLVEKSVQIELNKDKVDALNDRILAATDASFAEALEESNKSKQTLIDSQSDLDESKQTLIDSKQDLQDSEDELWDSKRGLEEGKDALNQALTQFEPENRAQLEALDDTIASLQTQRAQLVALIDGLKAAQEGFAQRDPAGDLTPEDLEALTALQIPVEGLVSVQDACNALKSALGQSEPQLTALDEGFAKALTGFQTMATAAGLGDFRYTPQNLTVADVQTIQESWASILVTAEANLRSQKASLESAESQLDDGLESITEGREQLDDSWASVSEGQEQIDEGWDSYNEGVESFEKQRREALLKANADSLLTLDTLSQLIYAQNFEMPAGYIDDQEDNAWLLKVGENYADLEEMAGTVLCNIHDVGDVRLSDVADITVIDNAADSYARMNGENSVILAVFKGSTSGTNEVSETCLAAIEELEAKYPGLSVIPLMDQGDYINIIVNSVQDSMIVGGILAIIALALFLKDLLPTLVVAFSIPLSVLAALVCMYFSGITLNMLTLSGLALGIGMLVDNSIVVIENIYRLRTRGIGAPRAAVQGTRQVAAAIISSTLTTVCVFLPMVFTTGQVRELMMPMCLTIIFCLMASLLVAMTVVPAAGSSLLRSSHPKSHPWFDRMQEAYGRLLAWCLKFKVVPLVLAILLLVFSVWQVGRMGIVVMPEMTTDELSITVTMPEDMEKEEAYATADQVMEAIMPLDGVKTVGAMVSGNAVAMISASSELSSAMDEYLDYMFYVTLEDEKAGKAQVQNLTDQILAATADLPCTVEVSSGADMSSLSASGLSINIYGPDLDTLQSVSEDVMEIVGQVEGFEEIENGQEDGDEVIHLILDKNKAMSLGLSVAQIYQELAGSLTVESTSTTVNIDGVEMDVVIKDETDPLTVENLMDYPFDVSVIDEDNDTVTETHTLGEFATIQNEKGVASINRENQSRYMTVTASVAEGYNVTLLARELEPLLEAYQAPDGYIVDLGGESESVNDMVEQMLLIMGLGLLFIYLVMVAQFQSLLSPFIVLFTVPLAFTGGLFGLLFTGELLSMTSLMGFVVLLGTVVNNGIVFVDYTNQLRLGGMERRAALIATGKTRMRPILMTALTTILAMTKMVMGDDMGSQLGKGMAIVIIGGLAYATLMTLFIIPVMYDILFKRKPLQVDVGSENLDDLPDDAAEFIQQEQQRQAQLTDQPAAAAPKGGD